MFVLNYEGAEMKITNPGAELRSYRSADGREWMWQSDPAVWKGCSPVLFPAIGGLKDDGATIAGKFYAVPRHGFARGMDFKVIEEAEIADGAKRWERLDKEGLLSGIRGDDTNVL